MYLRGVPAREMRAMLDFMYTGQAHLPRAHVKPLLKTAEALKIKGLGVRPEEEMTPISRENTSDFTENTCDQRLLVNEVERQHKEEFIQRKQHFDNRVNTKKRSFDKVPENSATENTDTDLSSVMCNKSSPKRKKLVTADTECNTIAGGNTSNSNTNLYVFGNEQSNGLNNSKQHSPHSKHEMNQLNHNRDLKNVNMALCNLITVKSEPETSASFRSIVSSVTSKPVKSRIHQQQKQQPTAGGTMQSLAAILDLEDQVSCLPSLNNA